MSRARSPSSHRLYGLARVCEVWGVSRATVYRHRSKEACPLEPPAKRGPRSARSDAEVLAAVREVLDESVFVGEGYRKVHARLRRRDIRVGPKRVLRIMREAGLLAPHRERRTLGPRAHDGTIVTTEPDTMWGTDATTTLTIEDGNVTVFIAVDHCTGECVGIHAAKPGTRYEALEPLRQGLREHFGVYEANIARGLAVRHDHGSQYTSDVFQKELTFLGIESSPSFVRSPEGNGCSERFIRTLKEQFLWLHTFRNTEELRLGLLEWKRLYNEHWLVERHGHRTPNQIRLSFAAPLQEAA